MNSPYFRKNLDFCLIYDFCFPLILILVHLCIMLYTYWTPLHDTDYPFIFDPPLTTFLIVLAVSSSYNITESNERHRI